MHVCCFNCFAVCCLSHILGWTSNSSTPLKQYAQPPDVEIHTNTHHIPVLDLMLYFFQYGWNGDAPFAREIWYFWGCMLDRIYIVLQVRRSIRISWYVGFLEDLFLPTCTSRTFCIIMRISSWSTRLSSPQYACVLLEHLQTCVWRLLSYWESINNNTEYNTVRPNVKSIAWPKTPPAATYYFNWFLAIFIS